MQNLIPFEAFVLTHTLGGVRKLLEELFGCPVNHLLPGCLALVAYKTEWLQTLARDPSTWKSCPANQSAAAVSLFERPSQVTG